MTDEETRRLLDTLVDGGEVGPYQEVVGGWVADGELPRLRALGHALVDLVAGEERRVQRYESALARVEEALALTEGPAWAEAAVELALAQEVRGRSRQAALLTAMTAQGQGVGSLLSLMARAEVEEGTAGVWLGLMQEMVVRGADLSGRPAAVRLVAAAGGLGHPLAALPPRLLPVETELPVPHRGRGGTGTVGLPFGPWGERGDRMGGDAAVAQARRITRDEDRARLTGVVRTWLERSNGRVEAEVFALDRPLEPESVAATLLTLELECLRGADPDALALFRVEPDEIVPLLFGAAANGGAYDSGAGGARGRLVAWQAMTALTGADPWVPVEEVARVAEGCSWWLLQCDTPWFWQVAWDFGVVALGPDRRRLAVLAASDTD